MATPASAADGATRSSSRGACVSSTAYWIRKVVPSVRYQVTSASPSASNVTPRSLSSRATVSGGGQVRRLRPAAPARARHALHDVVDVVLAPPDGDRAALRVERDPRLEGVSARDGEDRRRRPSAAGRPLDQVDGESAGDVSDVGDRRVAVTVERDVRRGVADGRRGDGRLRPARAGLVRRGLDHVPRAVDRLPRGGRGAVGRDGEARRGRVASRQQVLRRPRAADRTGGGVQVALAAVELLPNGGGVAGRVEDRSRDSCIAGSRRQVVRAAPDRLRGGRSERGDHHRRHRELPRPNACDHRRPPSPGLRTASPRSAPQPPTRD